ncbi:MAG: FmdE family protein [Sulfurospirillaceae bacterium]|nr:FmdE family protein [Sulfurospirillaceae bacterium]
MNETGFPDFFDQIRGITTYDPLAFTLGTVKNGIIKFNYKQIVKSAGHSCPTVAGAYLMTLKALDALYQDKLPVRGEIKVEFKEDEEDGVAGVIANVISNITGATQKSGFKGLGGRFARHSLMHFNADILSSARFTRTDNNKSVDVYYNPNIVMPNQKMSSLMQLVVQNQANEKEIKEFGTLWQERVKKILVDNFDTEELVKVL